MVPPFSSYPPRASRLAPEKRQQAAAVQATLKPCPHAAAKPHPSSNPIKSWSSSNGSSPRWILFDYSYRFFYKDGYGKHYRILNLKDQKSEEQRKLYLTAALLSFYQQLRIWLDHSAEFAVFNVERPLWVFFGSKVNVVRTESKHQVSDVVDVLLFFAEFSRSRSESIHYLDLLLNGTDGLIDKQNRVLFADSFPYLKKLKSSW